MLKNVLLISAFLLATAVGAAQTPAAGNSATPANPPRYVPAEPMDFGEAQGWIRLFDGRTLAGWDGPMDVWRVEDGAITVQSRAEPPTGPVYLLWTGGEPKDFEFKAEVKLEGEGANSGIQFRARRLGEVPDRPRSKWETRGYQADFDNRNTNTGALIECCAGASRNGMRPRPDRAFRGEVVRAAIADGGVPTLISRFGDAEALQNRWKAGDWNQLYLIVRGRTLMFFINGQLMSVFIDDHPTRAFESGVLSVQLEGRGDNKASFRNLWLKNL